MNPKRIKVDKANRPQTMIGIKPNNLTIEGFRQYINSVESKIQELLNENLKLKQKLNEFVNKKNQYDIKKVHINVEELTKKFSEGKLYLNELEKKIQLKSINQIALKDMNNPNNQNENQNDIKFKNLIAQYESQLEDIISKKGRIEDKLNNSEKEKEDLKNKFNDEFVLMSSVIYNLGFLYWSMKSDYEDKLKQHKGWLEMERIKQYNGDY